MIQMPDICDSWIREMEQEYIEAEEQHKDEHYCSNCGDLLVDGFFLIEGGRFCRDCGELWLDDRWEEL